ncbi:MAG: Y-family DNA polymerase [Wenzhouxiangella sp.]
MSKPAQALWAAVHCPALPLTAVWQLSREDGPIAVHELVRGQARILQAGRLARAHGIRPGQALTSALAILPQLHSRPRNRRAEARALEQIALTAYGHSHQVVLAPPDTVLLEAGGSQRLSGGIEPLLNRLCKQLIEQGFGVNCGLAPAPAPARLLARLNQRITSFAELRRYLAGLALTTLELDQESTRSLAGCGLETVGQLTRLPAAERARRFGKHLNTCLDELFGYRDTPLAGWQPPENFTLRLELPVATEAVEALMFVFNRALDHLGSWLEVRDQALTRLKITLEREDGGPPNRLEVALARAGFDSERLLELIRLKLDQLRLAAEVSALTLHADSTTEHRPPQADLFSSCNRNDAWPALLNRLTARLGEDGIASLAPRPDHRPERSWSWVPAGTTSPCLEERLRPTWLLPRPRPCRREQVTLEDGPERMEAGWWDGQDCRRDYWIARDGQGRRLWVFRESRPREGWFIHGIFE